MNRRTFLSSLSSLAAAAPMLACPPWGSGSSCGSSGNSSGSSSRGSSASSSRGSRKPSHPPPQQLELIEAPSNLGLRPPTAGHQPGTWRGPAVLLEAGLAREVPFARRVSLPRPAYSFDAEPGTRVRNGNTLRAFSLQLAAAVEDSLRRGARPFVLGGDCSNLLGSLLALRRTGGRGVVHIDGHSDFTHPGNFDLSAVLTTAAGSDLAMATGRGEQLLTEWPEVAGPLVADLDVVQIGERESDDPLFYKDLAATAMERITVQWAKEHGLAAATARVLRRLQERSLDRVWVHVDLDVLDERVMPAVDSPGRPGLDYAELGQLLRELLHSGRVAGLDVAIYDPDLDPDRQHARRIVEMLAKALA